MSGARTLEAAASLLGDRCRRDEPIGARTTYRVGGRAALFLEIEREEDFEVASKAVAETGVEVLVLGKGSNLLVADAGFPGLCVALGGTFAGLEIDPGAGRVVAGGALDYPVLARRSAAGGLSGMEWAVGIPGSVGGAVRMNAGGHGSETSERLVSCRLVDLSTGADRVAPAGDLDLAYRSSNLRPGAVVATATFSVDPGEPERSAATIAEIVSWRREHQPGGRNAGSTFSNPPGDAAGRLIEAAGLKGFRVGSAEVSSKHANFVQADAGGSADDVHRLVEEVRRRVADRLGVELTLELALVGRFR